jgi:hypothetical protein
MDIEDHFFLTNYFSSFTDNFDRELEKLVPASFFDSCMIGRCALSGRLIYDKESVIEALRDEIFENLNLSRKNIVALEIAQDIYSEAQMKFNVLILSLCTDDKKPIFLS